MKEVVEQTIPSVGRRQALKAVGVAGASALLVSTSAGAGADQTDRAPGAAPSTAAMGRQAMVEPGAGGWKTWVLTSPGEIPVPPPPSGGAAKRDHDDVLHAVAHRNAAMMDSISYWDTGSPGYRWNQIAAHQASMDPSPDTFRVMAYVNLAIYDATIATWKAKKQCGRKRPSEVGPPVGTAVPTPASPSYPSEHGAAAGAAVGVLSHLYPGIAADLEAKATEHGKSRVAAGVEHPTDFAAGLALGKAVASKLAERRIDVDGFGAPYAGDPNAFYPGGDESFPVTAADDFFGIMIGKWKTIAIGDPVAYRPPPPPAKGSAARAAELDEVRNYKRFEQPYAAELFFWPFDPSGRPEPDSVEFFSGASAAFHYALDVAFLAHDDLGAKILEYRLDANPPRAARAYALTFAALLDAAIACWNAKYHYLVGRPNQFDPDLKTLFITYPLPAYPSGHSANYTSVATMLGYLFPRDAAYFLSRAKENSASRLWAGIHFRSDWVEGYEMGKRVGAAVIDVARQDGS